MGGVLLWGWQEADLSGIAGQFVPTLRDERCQIVTPDGEVDVTMAEAAQITDLHARGRGGRAREIAEVRQADLARPEALTCSLPIPRGLPAQDLTDTGLTPRAQRVFDEVTDTFGRIPYGGFAPGGVSTGHGPTSKHYSGLAVDFFFRPYTDPAQNRLGWTIAHWLVAHADELDIEVVIYDDRIWSTNRSPQGWRPYSHPQGMTDPINRHLDHIHVDVYRGS